MNFPIEIFKKKKKMYRKIHAVSLTNLKLNKKFKKNRSHIICRNRNILLTSKTREIRVFHISYKEEIQRTSVERSKNQITSALALIHLSSRF